MKRTGYVFMFLITGVIGIILYYVFNPVKALGLVLPSFDEISFVHFDIKNDSALVRADVIVKNNQPYKLQVDTFYFRVRLEGSELVEEKVPLELSLSKYRSDTIRIPLHLSISRIRNLLADLRGRDSIELCTDIYLDYNTVVGEKKFNFTSKKWIAVPIPPEIKVLNVQQTDYRIGKSTAKALIKIQIVNEGKYVDLQLNDIHYNLNIPNTLSSVGSLNKSVSIKPGSSIIVDIPAVIKFEHPFKTAWLVARDKDQSRYRLNLRSNVRVNNFKGVNTIPMEVNATGMMELKK